jgi:hypothetical protein
MSATLLGLLLYYVWERDIEMIQMTILSGIVSFVVLLTTRSLQNNHQIITAAMICIFFPVSLIITTFFTDTLDNLPFFLSSVILIAVGWSLLLHLENNLYMERKEK